MRWIRDWALLLVATLGACGQAAPSSPWPDCRTGNQVVIVRGIFDPLGKTLLRLDPVRIYPQRSRPVPCQAQGVFIAEVVLANGGTVHLAFDALIADDAGRTQHGFFELTIPVSGQVARVRLIDAASGKVLADVASQPSATRRRERR
jgi:hypothetical protein